MTRCWLIFLTVVSLLRPLTAGAQHCHGMGGFHGDSRPWVVQHGLGFSGQTGPGYGRSFTYQTGSPAPYDPGAYWPQPVQVVSYGVSDGMRMPPASDPSKVPVIPSSPAARLRSLEHQARGDQRLREQKWSEARAAYRSSVDAAPDRAEGHLRLGLCLVAIQRFEPAIHQFKRALFIDPSIPQTSKVSTALFGPDSQIVRASIVSKVSDWVREDLRNSDRLFLLGIMLHFEGDARGREVLEAALRMKRKGDVSHLALFMGPPAEAMNVQLHPPVQGMPKLNDRPAPPTIPPLVVDVPLPKAPTPMPDGPIPNL